MMKKGVWWSLVLGSVCVTAWCSDDYPPALWVPAHPNNYTVSNRPSSYPIRYIIIHVAQGSYSGTISWFQNPNSRVSAHYVLRSSDGEVTQMVREKDVAWHAGNWTYNTQSIGLEHEGWINDRRWFTTAMYRSSSDLTRYVCRRRGIQRTRSYIIGHNEVPGSNHTDPGPYWDWNYYMNLIWLTATYHSASVPTRMRPGEQISAVVRFNNTGDISWRPDTSNPVRLGTQNPQDRSSPFYTAGNWLSPNRPTPVDYITNPNQVGSFSFVMTGPRSYGTYNESYQLVKEGISWFGPVVTFQIQVVPWDLIYDNPSSNFFVYGNWSTGTMAGDKYGIDYRWISTNPNSDAYARWYLNAPIDGRFDIYAWWSQGSNRSPSSRYEVVHADGTDAVTVNQQTNGGRWNYLGRFRFVRAGGYVYLKAQGPSGYVVIADAVRFVGPY